jgi:glycosyltransferase involved in cell wall biosynthesis
MLATAYQMTVHDFAARTKAQNPWCLFKQLFFLIQHIWSTDIVVCEFASYHSLLPVLMARMARKPSLVIIGGTDAHYFPQIGYGNYTKSLLGAFTRYTLHWATHIAPKHDSLIYHHYTYDTQCPPCQGVRAIAPEIKTPYTTIENGYDATQWYCDTPKIPRSFITVCGGLGYSFQYQLKGIDLYVAAARYLPDAVFTLIGVPVGYTIPDCPPNLTLIPATPNESLRAYYSTHQYYMQLSMAEGFPNALCEAMLCACVPIGSAVFSIPEIIADTGYILHERNETQLKALLDTSLASDQIASGQAARARVASLYTEHIRQDKLLALVAKLV